jgi:hypothetical protein
MDVGEISLQLVLKRWPNKNPRDNLDKIRVVQAFADMRSKCALKRIRIYREG